MCMYVGTGPLEEVVGLLEGHHRELCATERTFRCILGRVLGCVLRVLPRSANPSGEMYSSRDDVAGRYLETPVVNGCLRVLSQVLRGGRGVGLVPRKAVLQLAGQLRSDDAEERGLVCEILMEMCGCPQQVEVVLCGVSNELIGVLEGWRTHCGVEEALRVVCMIARLRAVGDEDMGVFYHQVVLRMAVTRVGGESREMALAMKLVCSHYPLLAPLSIRYFGRAFGSACAGTRVVMVRVLGAVVGTMCDARYAGVETEVCSIIEMSFLSDHHLVVEEAAEMVLGDGFRRVMARHAKTLMPRVFGAMYRASQMFWRPGGMCVVLRSLRMMLETDGKVFEECLRMYNEQRVERHGNKR